MNKPNTKIHIGNILYHLRTERRIDQATVANSINMDQGTYSKIETNQRPVEFETLPLFAKAFAVDLDTFINSNTQQSFNNCNQSGNNTQTINYNHSEKEFELLEKITELYEKEIQSFEKINSLQEKIFNLTEKLNQKNTPKK